ncbi:unnamed protein product [Rodentolepis nana]|uniref:MCM_OB domain-containing protein n=1 Tax=Rodentolepis nana TaxID=102285 RepID=A0A0R3T1W6_RODNA|nr:unnamed protein product [Rodentolepis nana]
MLQISRLLSRIVTVPRSLEFSHRGISSTNLADDTISDITADVAEVRSPKVPKALSNLKINEGGNINRADILGTITELKLLDRLSQPEKQWATLFVRTRVPLLSTSIDNHEPPSSESQQYPEAEDLGHVGGSIGFQMRTYHNRVHVFDRRLLPLVKRLKPGDRIFVTGFLSYYKPTGTSSSPEVAKLRKIGAVVAERLILLGSSSTQEDLEVDVD